MNDLTVAFDFNFGEKGYTAIAALTCSNRSHGKYSKWSTKCDVERGVRCDKSDKCDMSDQKTRKGRHCAHNE
jgi:hypothetical protein